MSIPVIAIDGPSASGKGTVARRVATVLGFHYLESGALYRLVALASLRAGIRGDDEARLESLARGLELRFQDGKIFLSQKEVSEDLYEEDCATRASEVARLARVRVALLARQRAFRRPPGLVADGRDMGTVVFPDASLKIFLTASPQVRAQRRYKQLNEKGIHANLHALSRELEARDARDVARAVAPLIAAADAVQLDSSTLSIEEVVNRILAWWRDRGAREST
ncbi:MAG TPA: (d)CMP kinase [Burkholderiales bacterium]|nr:(d)CMP kinase [Burkholderiales bacterium]